MYHC
jgi:hypothetical protein